MIDRRSHPTVPRERNLLPSSQFSDFATGWIAHGMSMRLPDDASDEFKQGYAERRNSVVSELLGSE
jgi:hypothetical protein